MIKNLLSGTNSPNKQTNTYTIHCEQNIRKRTSARHTVWINNAIQETSFKKIIVEGEYMLKNWFCVRTQNNWIQAWNNLNGGNYWRKVKKHDKNYIFIYGKFILKIAKARNTKIGQYQSCEAVLTCIHDLCFKRK